MKKEREQEIIRYLAEHEMLSTEEAIRLFNASPATVRRDFNILAEGNIVRRVRGGIKRIAGDSSPAIPFSLREQWYSEEKERLARKAMEFIKPDSVIFIHGGSTTTCLGMFLETGTIITNSVGICEILRQRFPAGGGPEVLLPGGRMDFKAGIMLGSVTERAIAGYRADIVILSTRGLDKEGLLDTDDASVGIQKSMIENASKVILLADHSKFGMRAMCRSVSWDQIDILITSYVPENQQLLDSIRSKGVELKYV